MKETKREIIELVVNGLEDRFDTVQTAGGFESLLTMDTGNWCGSFYFVKCAGAMGGRERVYACKGGFLVGS